MNLGVIIILIAAFGYLSNTLNWRYLNFGVIRFLYYIGALVHETSHAVLCIFTGAKIRELPCLRNSHAWYTTVEIAGGGRAFDLRRADRRWITLFIPRQPLSFGKLFCVAAGGRLA